MSGLENTTEMAYSPKLQLGTGLHILSGNMAAASPFEPNSLVLPQVRTVARYSKFTVSKLRTVNDVETVIKNNVQARAPIKGVPVSVTASYLRDVKVSDLEMVTLIDTTYETAPQIVPENVGKLTDEAQRLLDEDPKKFADRYGDYFVAGYSSRSSLTAVATHRSTGKEELNKLALTFVAALDETSLKENVPIVDKRDPELAAGDERASLKSVMEVAEDTKATGVKDLSRSFTSRLGMIFSNELNKRIRDLQIETTIDIHAPGVDGLFSAIILDQLVAVLDQLRHNIAPEPYVVYLRSYRSISAKCLSPAENPIPQLSDNLTSGFTQIYTLQSVVLSSTYPEVMQCKTAVSQLIDDLTNIDPFARTQLETWTARLNEQKTLVQKRIARRDFVQAIKKDYTSDRWPYLTGYKFGSKAGDKHARHESGLRPDYLPPLQDRPDMEFIRGEINTRSEPFRYANKLIPSHPRLKLPTDGGWVIGWTLVNERTDGYSGEAVVKQADREAVEIEFHPDSLRDSWWSLVVYSIDRGLYHIE